MGAMRPVFAGVLLVAFAASCDGPAGDGSSASGGLSLQRQARTALASPALPRLPRDATPTPLVLVLPDGSDAGAVLRRLKAAGTRVLAAWPPRTVVVDAPPAAATRLRAALPGVRTATAPDDPALDALPETMRPSLRRMLAGRPAPSAHPMAPVNEAPPTLRGFGPSGNRIATFAGAPRNDVMEFLQGTVVVAVIIPDSNGAIDPKTESWKPEDLATTKQRLEEGVLRYLDYDPTGDVTFVFHYESANPGGLPDTVACDYEAVNYSTLQYSNDYIPWCGILGSLGHPCTQNWPPFYDYLNELRDQYQADWAFLIKVINEESWFNSGAPTNTAHADVNGPTTTLYTTNGPEVYTHELGHIFGALDEYCGSNGCPEPTYESGYLGVTDGNAQGQQGLGFNGGHGEMAQSLMVSNTTESVTPYSMQAWGISDSDGDGVPDVQSGRPDTAFELDEVQADGTVFVTGTTRVTPLPTTHGKPPGTSVKSVRGVEWRVDGNAWQAADATDGAFDAGVEAFSATVPGLTAGVHVIEARGVDSRGLVERSPARRRVVIPAASAATDMPLFAALQATPDVASTGMSVTLDASASTDGAAGTAGMTFRFDLDGDGTFDTPASGTPYRAVPAGAPGTHEAAVEVSAPGRAPVVGQARWTSQADDLPPRARLVLPAGDRVLGDPHPSLLLDASGSADPEGTPLTYRFQIEGPGGPIDTGFTAKPTLAYAPLMPALMDWHLTYLPQKTWITDIDLDGSLLAACDQDLGFSLLDVSDPKGPVVLAQATLPGLGEQPAGGAVRMARLGPTRRLVTGEATWVVDWGDAATPGIQVLGAVPVPGNQVATHGTWGYVASGSGLTLIDVADPAHPTVVSKMSDAKMYLFRVIGDRAFFQAAEGALTLYDLHEPAAPTIAATFPAMNGYNVRVAGQRGYAWGLDNHVVAFDPTKLPDLVVLGQADLPAPVAWATDNLLFLNDQDVLVVVDVTDLATPQQRMRLGPLFDNALVRELPDHRVLAASMGIVETGDWTAPSYVLSAGVRATLTVRDGAGLTSTAQAYAWLNPYDHPPALTVGVDPASAASTLPTPFTFTLTASDPDAATTWDGVLAWRADLDGDGNWEGDYTDLDPSNPTITVTTRYGAPGPYDAVFEVRDRFRATARTVVHVEVTGGENAQLLAVDPAGSAPGVDEWVDVLGAALDLPIASLSFGDGVQAIGVKPLGPTRIRVRIQVATNAATGPRDVVATFADGEAAKLAAGFTIIGCAVQTDPRSFTTVPRASLMKLHATGGAFPYFLGDKPMESGGFVQQDGIYASGPVAGRDVVRAVSQACCDAQGKPYEDCRSTLLELEVDDAQPDRVLRFQDFGGAVVAAGDGATFQATSDGVSTIDHAWVLLDLSGTPPGLVTATLTSPAGTVVTLLAGAGTGATPAGWAPLEWTPAQSLDAFDGEDPHGTWALFLHNDGPAAASLATSRLALRGPANAGAWDWQPPHPVTDLAVEWQPDAQQARLTWTAPADAPGGKPVNFYEMRVAGDEFRYWNWYITGQMVQAGTPAAPGTAEQLAVGALEAGNTYWFSLRSQDRNGNTSPMSNPVVLIVPQPPIDGPPDTAEAPAEEAEPTSEASADGAEETAADGPAAEAEVVEPAPEVAETVDAAADPTAAESPAADAPTGVSTPPEASAWTSGGGCMAGPGSALAGRPESPGSMNIAMVVLTITLTLALCRARRKETE